MNPTITMTWALLLPFVSATWLSEVAVNLENGGSVSDDIEYGNVTVTGRKGLYALRSIPEGTILVDVVPDSLICSDTKCGLVDAIEAEMRAETYDYSPAPEDYPPYWSLEIMQELQGLPPYDSPRHLLWYTQVCNRELSDPVRRNALYAYLVLAAEADHGFCIQRVASRWNHDRRLANVKRIQKDGHVYLQTLREVVAGEEFVGSYRILDTEFATTPIMYRDYGFLENYPRSWWWQCRKSHSKYSFEADSDKNIVVQAQAQHSGPAKSKEDIAAHNLALSYDTLGKFISSAQQLRSSFPTSWQEDELLLTDINLASDLRGLLEYRMAFKKDLQAAVSAAAVALHDKVHTEL